MMRKFARSSAALAGASIALFWGAGPASAAVWTITNPTGGAQAIFENTGVQNIVQACDKKADSHSAVTELSLNPSAGTIAFRLRDGKGSGTCATDYIAYSSGSTQYMRACLADGTGPSYSCSAWKQIRVS